jgi:uncharacterized protein YPO0396
MTDMLLGSSDDTALFDPVTQWRAESLQVINWGGFHGYRHIDLSAGSTLISGASGTGKSTLMDAYLAAMMPSDVPFNGASNDTTTGRARSPEQRNLLTYLRGKVDARRDSETGALRDVNLRGDDETTWGAVGITFRNDDERRFTVLRAYLVPKRARGVADISMTMATVDDTFDLRRLEDFAASRFHHLELTGRVPGLVVRDTYQELAYAIQTRLGIGAAGGGNRAMRLLARIQAGQHMPTVDSLYKSMVLETPGTYEAADRALDHFAALDESYAAMDAEDRKVRILGPIHDLHARIAAANDAAAEIDGLGLGAGADDAAPFQQWVALRRRALLDDEVDRNARQRTAARAELEAATAMSTAAEIALRDAEERLRDNGGNALAQLEDRISRRNAEGDAIRRARTTFEERTMLLDDPILSEQDFIEAVARSTAFLVDHDVQRASLSERRDALTRDEYPLLDEERSLRLERSSLEHRQGAMPLPMHEARVAMARAAGLDPAEVPFIAELLDVLPGEEDWRPAIESVLGSVARTLLVAEEHLDAFSTAIDDVRIPVRVAFEGVPTSPHEDVDGDPLFVSGKLAIANSPFSAWVRSRITSERVDARCVLTPEELGGGGRRVTRSGQLRDGRRGQHGDRRGPNVIGFTNTERLAEVDRQLTAVARDIADLEARRTAITKELSALESLRAAHQYRADTAWHTIDTAGLSAELQRLDAERASILAADDGLRALRSNVADLRAAFEVAADRRAAARVGLQRLDARHGELVDWQDAAASVLEASGDAEVPGAGASGGAGGVGASGGAGGVGASGGAGGVGAGAAEAWDRAEQFLDSAWAEFGETLTLDDFDDAINRFRRRLQERLAQSLEGARSAAAALETTFERYLDAWPDPNLGSGVASYPDFARILDTIIATGLHSRRGEWRRRLSQWSGEDLVPLAGAFDRAVADIEERLEPVNEILQGLPFGANRDRLRIALRRVGREDVTRFRKELRELSAGSSAELDDDALEARFRRLRRFMDVIRPDSNPARGRTTTRDAVLDVRRHMEITAVRYDVNGNDLGVYSSLGDKSGGETQELVAFIVGAALRYQLGDESRPRPRFAPVFLDEAFIKADSEFAGRAVAAWLALGFQLVVSAPLDKVTALEPAMERLLSMRKDPVTGYSAVTEIRRYA